MGMAMLREELDRLTDYLTLWAAWVRRWKPSIGYPQRAAGLHTGGSVQSFADLTDQADDYAARTLNGMIESLPPAQQCAIHAIHLGAVWRFPRQNRDELYEQARTTLEAGLIRWGLA
jgi:hypothetical protein